jgi:hypothetical protein
MATRIDYIRTAKILAEFEEQLGYDSHTDLCQAFADMYFLDNNNFNHLIFFNACRGGKR